MYFPINYFNVFRLVHRSNNIANSIHCRNYVKNRQKFLSDVQVHVIGSGAFGDPASVYIRANEHKSCLFNCGDSTARLLIGKPFKTWNVSNIFLTKANWERIGGVPSIAKTIYDRYRPFPILHGPPKLDQCLQRFASLTDLNPDEVISPCNYNNDIFFEDSTMRIEFVQLYDSSAVGEVVAYVGWIKPHKRQFSLKACKERNVPGELINTLKAGKDVTLDDGSVVTSDDVLLSAFAGVNFLVIDIPTEDYLNNIAKNQELNIYLDEIKASQNGMEFVLHFSPPNIVELPKYHDFMRKTAAYRHLQLNENNIYTGCTSAYKMQASLNELNADIFPILRTNIDPSPPIYISSAMETHCESTENGLIHMEPVSRRSKYVLMPETENKKTKRNRKEVKASVDEQEDDSTDDEDDDDGEDDNDNIINSQRTTGASSTVRANTFPRVVFLGTGSTFSTTTRNVTGILVHTSPDSCILLDCGEGTIGQMSRFYGDQSSEVFKSLKAVFISHMHGDHHFSFLDLMRMRKRFIPINRTPLIVMAPKDEFQSLLDFYDDNIDTIRGEYTLIDNADLMNSEIMPDVKKHLKIKDLRTCRVKHIESSYGISLTTDSSISKENVFKLTFSGDTMPCDELIALGQSSTLLIHEATFEDSRHSRAALTNHSTVAEAIEQGRKMNAKYTILTHFSQRYWKMPLIDGELDKNMGIAFDNMELIETDLDEINGLYTKAKEMFQIELEKSQARSERFKSRFDCI